MIAANRPIYSPSVASTLDSVRAWLNETRRIVFLTGAGILQVYPIAGALPAAKDAGARVVIVNAQPTPFDELADAVLHGDLSEILAQLVGAA
jgi:NAD-dependent SIR2 family protein deacetylase